MSNNGQETEAKFYVQDLGNIKGRLKGLGARLVQERVLETNVRFDLPDGSLRVQGRVLRLRRDTEAKYTYKGAGKNSQGVLSREEIEFSVGDFEKAKQFLEALGYQEIFIYEKYRATYEVDQTSIMLDELPYGNFMEIEGETEATIRDLAEKLNLNWDTAIERSYSALFDDLHKKMNLPFRDLTFANFTGIHINASQLGVTAADR
jgi:adenylate cyclase class 2